MTFLLYVTYETHRAYPHIKLHNRGAHLPLLLVVTVNKHTYIAVPYAYIITIQLYFRIRKLATLYDDFHLLPSPNTYTVHTRRHQQHHIYIYRNHGNMPIKRGFRKNRNDTLPLWILRENIQQIMVPCVFIRVTLPPRVTLLQSCVS